MADVRRITPAERTEGVATPGIIREEAFATEGMWAGLARMDVGMVSGWHHHADHETAIFMLSGILRMEYGPDGTDIIEAGPGDYLHVARRAVHRESDPGEEVAEFVVVRAGSAVPGSFMWFARGCAGTRTRRRATGLPAPQGP